MFLPFLRHGCCCVEIGTDTIALWVLEKDRRAVPRIRMYTRFATPPDALWQPEPLAAAINEHLDDLPIHKLVILLNTAQTVLRLADKPALGGKFDAPEYVCAQTALVLPGRTIFLHAALPSDIASCMAALVKILCGHVGKLAGVDVLAHWLVRHLQKSYDLNGLWICLPQDGGLRLLTFGADALGSFFIDGGDRSRAQALQRMMLARATPDEPSQVLVLAEPPTCDWVRDYFAARAIAVPDLDIADCFRAAVSDCLQAYR